MSLTVMVKLQEFVPHALVAVAVTIVVPAGKVEPGAWEYAIVGKVPVAVAAKLTARPQVPGALLVVMLAGQVIVGGVQPLTTSVPVPVLLEPSQPVPGAAVTVNV